MSFNQLPTELKRKIFSYLGGKEYQTLRHVDSNCKAVIADMAKWRGRCTMNGIKPWKNQLIKLQYPSLKTGHFAVGTRNIGGICFFDINERIDKTHEFHFNYYVDGIQFNSREIERFNRFYFSIEMKLWITGNGTVINVVYFRNRIFFWDVNRKIKIQTPLIFRTAEFRKLLLSLRRGTDEYFYLINTVGETMNVIRLDYVENEITTTEILKIYYTEDDSYELIDFYAEGRKIMIIHQSRKLKNFLLTTIVKLPQSKPLPVTFSAYNDKYTAIAEVRKEILEYYKLIIPCINVVIAYAIENARKFIVQVSSFDKRNKHITTLKHYEIPERIMPGGSEITCMSLYFNHLFVATTEGKLIIFKLKNLQHLKYLKFDKSLKRKIIDTKVSNNKFKITKYNDQIIILLESFTPEVKFMICDLNL
ncbi:uncharacterized protein LOC130677588 isoform X2 [Microplitis mediator]|uniref:uncharacterized protein LOC130677588 isoform X2 n=1 Tax=Microplitis mediator TaxID=375433 RepID=UPI002555DD1F|nr:uncharacterized protein LOC130677588 isoform X2 [Microplitis mediator]